MKRLIIVFTFFAAILVANAQNVKVKSIECLNSKTDTKYYHPVLSPDGKSVAVTTENYNSLWLLDIETQNVQKISSKAGAGYEPQFSVDGSVVYYRTNEYEGLRKYSSILKYTVRKRATEVLAAKKRDVRLMKSAEGNIIVVNNGSINTYSGTSGEMKRSVNESFVFIENSKMMVYYNGNANVLSPVGDFNYIWPSLSPDKKKLLFTVAGKGTYVSNLDGTNAVSIGYLNAPSWLNNNWIAGMRDKDNGQIITASDIFMISADGKQTIQVTNTEDEIEMYPQSGNGVNKLVYHTLKGKIYLVRFEY